MGATLSPWHTADQRRAHRTLERTHDAESGSQGLHAGQLARPAVVNGVGGHQVGQQPHVATPHLFKGRLVQSAPGAVNDGDPSLSHELPVEDSAGMEDSGGTAGDKGGTVDSAGAAGG